MNDFNLEFSDTVVVPSGEHNAIETISVNGVVQPIVSENVNIVVPTKTSELTNDSDYVTSDKIPTAPIQAITVDGVEQTPDENGVVNLELGIPEGVATESYVDEKIGEIGEVLDSINADLSAIQGERNDNK